MQVFVSFETEDFHSPGGMGPLTLRQGGLLGPVRGEGVEGVDFIGCQVNRSVTLPYYVDSLYAWRLDFALSPVALGLEDMKID